MRRSHATFIEYCKKQSLLNIPLYFLDLCNSIDATITAKIINQKYGGILLIDLIKDVLEDMNKQLDRIEKSLKLLDDKLICERYWEQAVYSGAYP
ncbi:hypothetical protein D3C74_403370 [compost metagenome]